MTAKKKKEGKENLLIKFYERKVKKFGADAYKHILDIFDEAETEHKKTFTKSDHGQAWRSYKGKNFETLILHIIKNSITNPKLAIISGTKLEKATDPKLSESLAIVKRNLLIDYGQYGYHMPDVDIVVYERKTQKIKAVISVKVTLRERVAQSGYWRYKMQNQPITKNIKFYFVTADTDRTLKEKTPAKKGRAIVETDMDGGYSLENVEESDRVKNFDKLIKDLRKL